VVQLVVESALPKKTLFTFQALEINPNCLSERGSEFPPLPPHPENAMIEPKRASDNKILNDFILKRFNRLNLRKSILFQKDMDFLAAI
jgi:hypothetical protein